MRAIDAGVFNHVSGYVADVVWQGLSTYHVKEGIGEQCFPRRTARILAADFADGLYGQALENAAAPAALYLHALRPDFPD